LKLTLTLTLCGPQRLGRIRSRRSERKITTTRSIGEFRRVSFFFDPKLDLILLSFCSQSCYGCLVAMERGKPGISPLETALSDLCFVAFPLGQFSPFEFGCDELKYWIP